jgi:hypothetical protein
VPPGHTGWNEGRPGLSHAVVAPDARRAKNGFAFDKLGVRVPAVLVSPWLDAGSTIGWDAPDRAHQRTMDHTSILRTVQRLVERANIEKRQIQNVDVLRYSRRAQQAAALDFRVRNAARSASECPGRLHPTFSESHYVPAAPHARASGRAAAHARVHPTALPGHNAGAAAARLPQPESGPERELLDAWCERDATRDWGKLEAHVQGLLAAVETA